MIFSLRSSRSRTYASAFSGAPTSSSIFIASSFAPPWSGPLRAAIAPVIALNMSARVDAMIRAVNVEAFIVWSAYSTNVVSSAEASSRPGSIPSSIARKFAACGSFGFGGRTSCPVRSRW